MPSKGTHLSEEVKRKIGQANLGRRRSKETLEKLGQAIIGKRVGENNPMWKGDNVGYASLHEWVGKYLPKPNTCQMCNKVPPYDLANISGEYKRDLGDWRWLCRSCHIHSDDRLKNLDHRVDMSNRICSLCGSNKTTPRSDNGRPSWHYLNNELVCHRCYQREYSSKTPKRKAYHREKQREYRLKKKRNPITPS